MNKRHICVPNRSPAWRHYLRQGWITLWEDGSWVHMVQP